jgi:arylsulfatase A-like enzyme
LKPGPLECGFDYFFGVPHIGQLPHFFIKNHDVVGLSSDDPIHITRDGAPEWELDYIQRPRTYNPILGVTGGEGTRYTHEDVSIRLADEAVSWLEQQHNDKPFLLYFAPRNVHAPIRPNGRFKGSSIGAYGDYISELDWSVGRILDTIDQMKLTSNTIVIFTSDNGAVQLGHVPAQTVDYQGHKANGPLRGQKTEIYEGGHRIPFIARWPSVVQPGSESNQLIALTDMLATFSDLFGDPLPDDAGEDSFSFLHALLGTESTGEVRENIVHDSHQVQYAVRQGPWKLLLCQGGGGLGWKPENMNLTEPVGQLYNMDEDLGETVNRYNDKPGTVQELTALLERLRQDGRSRSRR